MSRIALLALIAVAVARTATADNTTSANAYSMAIGGTPSEATVVAGTTDRWYAVGNIIGGRSYCAETQAGVSFDTSASAGIADTQLFVYHQNATALVGTNDDAYDQEPSTYGLSRVCYIAAANELPHYVKVSAFSGTFNVRA